MAPIMCPSARRCLLLISTAVLLSSAATASAFNISTLLGRFPGFEQFNQLLSRTHLAEEVDRGGGITVLGLSNDRIGTLMQMPEEVQKSILSFHIVLDYYDMAKLAKLAPGKKTTLTTLYQGFIHVVRRSDGTIVFGSSAPGSPQVTNFINPVAAQPFNISVLSVSQPIIAPGTYVELPRPRHRRRSVLSVSQPIIAPAKQPPPPAKTAPAPAAKLTPPPAASPLEADAPASAPSPAPAYAPAPSPDAAGADEGEGDADAADLTPEVEKSGSVKASVGLGLGIGLAAAAAAFLAGN